LFKSIYLNDEEYVKYIFETFTERMSFNIEQAYQDLDQNYKEKRFGSLQNFTQYVSKNKELYLSYTKSGNRLVNMVNLFINSMRLD
jgi:hypothetical protein